MCVCLHLSVHVCEFAHGHLLMSSFILLSLVASEIFLLLQNLQFQTQGSIEGGMLKEDVEANRDDGVIVFKMDSPQGAYDIVYHTHQV